MTDREKQIEGMARVICKSSSNRGQCETCGFHRDCNKFEDATALYEAGYGVTLNQWISVEERLPDADCYCLIYTTVYFTPDHCDEPDHYNSVEKSYYSTEFGFMGTHGIYAKAWMPLPTPPKEG